MNLEKINNDISVYDEFLIYKTDNDRIKIEVYIKNETIWLTQAKISELFEVDRSVITKHLKNIYLERELEKDSTCAKVAQVQIEGARKVNKNIEYYNLDAIIAVGYRVNSKRATMFRIWATNILKEYIIKGFAMDDERLKNPNNIFGKDYFDEQLERIKDIRSSERRFYQKITDIYAQCSADYNSKSELTIEFYKTVQNKFHYAISKETAAEIIYNRVDSEKANLGLTNWKNSPKGKIRKNDVSIAKNYLDETELKRLNNIVVIFLDIAQDNAERAIPMYMNDWIKEVDRLLEYRRYDILNSKGKISAEAAKMKAETEYEKYKVIQDKNYISDFDQLLNETKKLENTNERQS